MPKPDVFRVIADPSRRAILGMLTKKASNINTLASNFAMSRPAVSKHIKLLQEARLISIEEKGRERTCQLNPEGFKEFNTWLSHFNDFWNEKLQNLEQSLKEKSQ